MDIDIHSWHECRAGGCGDCCTCGEKCHHHHSYMTTAQELIEMLQKLPKNARIVIEKEHHVKYLEIADLQLIGLKYNSLEYTYFDRQPDGALAPPEGAEEAYALCMFE